MRRIKELTEIDVYNANIGIIKEVCSKHGKILYHEDRKSIASIGMLYAIRTYRRGISEFSQYATICMQEMLLEAENDQRKMKRIEHPISLNMFVRPGDGPATFGDFIQYPNSDCTSSIIIIDFLNNLEDNLSLFARLCIDNYTIEEIAETMHISVTDINRMKDVLRLKWEEYIK